MSGSEILRHLRPGDVIVVEQVLGEPTALLDELLLQGDDLPEIRLFVGMSVTDVFARVPSGIKMLSTVGMSPNSQLITSGHMELVPLHMSQLPWLLTEGPVGTDVAMILVSPPDADGWCSLGVTSDYIWSALGAARVVLAEINENVPVVAGDTRVHVDQIAYSIRTSRRLPEYARSAPPSEQDRVIAANVARYVNDGSCIQVGIGRMIEALLSQVADRRDLGVHSGMVGDTMLEMMRDGIITNKAKAVDTGLTVVGSILGSSVGINLARAEKNLRVVSIAQTHDPARIAALDNFVCVNSALEVDLFGQVNSETVGGRYVGATGGAVDYLRGSVRAPGGHSIVALPAATAKGRSRVVPRVETVTALGTDVDVIATDYGYAELRGVSAGERAGRIIKIAAPEQREALRKAAAELGL